MLKKIVRNTACLLFLFSNQTTAEIISLNGSLNADHFQDIFGSTTEYPLGSFDFSFEALIDSSEQWKMDAAGRTTKSVEIIEAKSTYDSLVPAHFEIQGSFQAPYEGWDGPNNLAFSIQDPWHYYENPEMEADAIYSLGGGDNDFYVSIDVDEYFNIISTSVSVVRYGYNEIWEAIDCPPCEEVKKKGDISLEVHSRVISEVPSPSTVYLILIALLSLTVKGRTTVA